MLWHEEQTEEEALKRIARGLDVSVGGTYNHSDIHWSIAIKKLKDNPVERFELAVQNLPYPAAFREAALGLRKLIKDKKKKGENFEAELAELYTLAAWESFCPIYSNRALVPGFAIFERIPGGKIAALEANYQDLGYEKLGLINKTDAKLLDLLQK